MAQKEKKLSDARIAANTRYNAKTYTQYCVYFRKIDDEDIIAAINELKEFGCSTSEAFKLLIREGIAARR